MLSLLLLALPLSAAATQMQAILHNTHRGDNYHYPTDLTRGILPIPVHSHNDYWRDIPFYTGLSNGCMSTEADVWLYNDTLYVGHDESSLTHERTLESLYINPILDVLERQNPQTPFVTSPTKNGVFDTDTAQTLYFFIDVKTSGPETFQAVISALEPLRQQGYLTTLKNNKTLTTGPVTIIGTGDTPLSMVGPVEDRDYFYDAKLESLDEPENAAITSLISPIASTSFKDAVGTVNLGADSVDTVLDDKQLKALRAQIEVAEERGIGARYWETPYFPVRIRNLIWRLLLQEGVTLLNADDLEAVADYF